MKSVPGMKGWIDIGSDVNWEDYHGMWARKARDGSWYVLRFDNSRDSCGDRAVDNGEIDEFICDVKRFDGAPDDEIDSALRSSGFRREDGTIVSDSGDVFDADVLDLVLLEACIRYGLGAPLESFSGKVRPRSVRAKARRYAEECMRDADLLAKQLARPVNKIGSTAAECGHGDIDSALKRGPATPEKNLVRTISGMGPLPTAQPAHVGNCKFKIIALDHYRQDGSCMCDDAVHRAIMIGRWGYEEDEFSDIPLRG